MPREKEASSAYSFMVDRRKTLAKFVYWFVYNYIMNVSKHQRDNFVCFASFTL